MTATLKTIPPTPAAPKATRTVTLDRDVDPVTGEGGIHITTPDGRIRRYVVAPLGRGRYILQGLDADGFPEDDRRYLVLLAPAERSCNCPAGSHGQSCVHVGALQALERVGLLGEGQETHAETLARVSEAAQGSQLEAVRLAQSSTFDSEE